jgi:methylase of polypeptide subunit release factors
VTDERAHWESTYAERTPEKVSWFEPCPQRSLELIQAARVGHEASVLDVGGGASSLAAHMLSAGYTDRTVADISPAALAHARAELGSAAALQQVLGEDFELVSSSLATHQTPSGASQQFLYAHMHRPRPAQRC